MSEFTHFLRANPLTGALPQLTADWVTADLVKTVNGVTPDAAGNVTLPDSGTSGLPVGGTTGQSLVKASATDYDVTWATVSGGTGGAVDSVNGQTGAVVLAAADVGAAATVHTHAIADVTDAGGAASLDVGTTAGTVAAGDHTHTPASIGAATSAQGALADSATQPGDDAGTLGSGTATAGQVLTADGAGAASWQEASGGGGGGGGMFPYPPITSGEPLSKWWAGPAQSGTGSHRGAGYASLYPLPIGQPVRLTGFRINVTTAGTGLIHAALYGTVDGADPRGAAKVADLLVGADATTTGAKTATSLAIDLTPGLYWVAILVPSGETPPAFAGTAGDAMALFVPKRDITRSGGLDGASGLTTLPATYPAADSWNIGGSMVWVGLQTAVIP